MTLRAYLDNNATTALLPQAFEAMRPYLTELFLNPASAASRARGDTDPVADARLALAQAFGDESLANEFVLTSGASEANSWVVQAGCPAGGHMVTTGIEHPSVRRAAEAARARGVEVDFIRCESNGRVEVQSILNAVRSDTALVSVILANNETGVIQPVREIAEGVRQIASTALIHTDATQALGRIPVDLAGTFVEVDLLSLSGHKFHGPGGVGALFVREGVTLAPMIHGQQDDGRRGGTANSAAAAGLAIAAREIFHSLSEMSRVRDLRDRLEAGAKAIWAEARINGEGADRLPNTASITFPGKSADEIVDELALQGICIASGSACDSGTTAPSHVLTAMGLSYEDAKATLRFSLSAATESTEIDVALRAIEQVLHAQPAQ